MTAARPEPIQGMKRRQLLLRRLQNAISSPNVAIHSPFTRVAKRGRNHRPIEWVMSGAAAASATASFTVRKVTDVSFSVPCFFDGRAQVLSKCGRTVLDRQSDQRVEYPAQVLLHRGWRFGNRSSSGSQ